MKNQFISIKIGRNRYSKIFVEDIVYCKADRAYSIIKTIKKDITISKPLKVLEGMLTKYDFIRLNRSYLVNITHCIELKYGSKSEVLLSNKEIISYCSKNDNTLAKHFGVNVL